MKLYDCVIIGGGPAGLSAAIYLARFNRSVIVLDKCEGRWRSREHNENYFGFPEGISAKSLVLRGRQQAEFFGSEFLETTVVEIELDKENDNYLVKTDNNEIYLAKTLLFATGVSDNWPAFSHLTDYIGQSLFWCITCDGFKVKNKKIAVVGSDDEAVVSCLQFLQFTDQIVFITNAEKNSHSISKAKLDLLKKYSITFHEGFITNVEGKDGFMNKVILSNDEELYPLH